MKNKRLAMVVYSNYPHDPRVRREAEALAEEDYEIDIFCLDYGGQSRRERYGSIRVYRSSISRSRSGRLIYIFEYFLFILTMMMKVFIHFVVRGYRIIHVHNMPDILVLAGLLPKLFGAKVILDLHDPMPEVYMTKYGIDEGHRMIKILVGLERFSIHLADRVFTPNRAFRDVFISRGIPPDKITIIMNSPMESLFHGCPCVARFAPGDTFRLVYHGSIVRRHGLTDALDAVELLETRIPRLRFDVYGGGDFADGFRDEINRRKLDERVFFHGFITQDNLVDKIIEADLGVIPNRRTPFTEINFPTRIFEYLCLGMPVIVPRTKGISDYFDSDSLLYFESGSPEDLAEQIWNVYRDPERTISMTQKGINVYNKNIWSDQKKQLTAVARELIH